VKPNTWNSEKCLRDDFGSHYERVLLSCVIASEAIYKKTPIEKINNDFYYFNHYIERATVKSSYFNIINDNPYLVESNTCDTIQYLCCKKKKILIVAFKGTNILNINDLSTDVNVLPQQYSPSRKSRRSFVHKGFFVRSRIISIQYFLDKIILDDYKVVFTGHSLGAAVAALVAVRVIFDGNISDPRKKVFFIGFGCPPIGNQSFCDEINENFSKNFHFYSNKLDVFTAGVGDSFNLFGRLVKLDASESGHGIKYYNTNVIDFIKSSLDYDHIKTKHSKTVIEY
jgi:hypothetical protein